MNTMTMTLYKMTDSSWIWIKKAGDYIIARHLFKRCAIVFHDKLAIVESLPGFPIVQ